MLTCVFHPIDAMRVVEEEEAERLSASGVWFDSPALAQKYREKVEAQIKDEQKVDELDKETSSEHPKAKFKRKSK